MILRPAFLSDADALAALGRDSFVAKFGDLYRAQDLNRFLEEVYAPAVVAEEIAASACQHCLAEDEQAGALVGYAKIWLESEYRGYSDAQNPIALGQLYTDPEMTGRGIGARLMDWALEQARVQQADAIQFSVFSENYDAQRFYARYGASKIADIDFYVGDHRDDEFLYEIRL